MINFNGKKGSKVPVGKLTGKETSPDVKCKQTPRPPLPPHHTGTGFDNQTNIHPIFMEQENGPEAHFLLINLLWGVGVSLVVPYSL
jgi:hypothetical protein